VDVYGAQFTAASTVNWNGTPLHTDYLNQEHLQAFVPAPLVTTSGVFQLTVSSPGASSSAPFPLAVNPVLNSLSPAFVPSGASLQTLTLVGIGFTPTGDVTFDLSGSSFQPLPVTFINSNTLRVQVPGNLLATPRYAGITVTAGFGPCPAHNELLPNGYVTSTQCSSNPQFLTIGTPPIVTALTPASSSFDVPAFVITLDGANFRPGAKVFWGSSDTLTTAWINANRLTAVLTAAQVARPPSALGTIHQVAVTNPDGGVSNNNLFYLLLTRPAISTLTPLSAIAGGPAFTLRVTGSSFTLSSILYWENIALQTTFVSTNELDANVPSSLVGSSGQVGISVRNPTPDLGPLISDPISFAINPPRITSLTPASAPAGSTALTLTVSGSGFLPGTAIGWNGILLATTFTSGSIVSASVPAALLQTSGQVSVTARNGQAASDSFVFSIVRPVITGLTPVSVTAGSAGFLLILSGTGFLPGSTVLWNGAAMQTTFANAGEIWASIPVTMTETAGNAMLTVVNPGGEKSNAVDFPVMPVPPAVTSGGILNWASGLPAIAPGSLVSIYGSALATTVRSAESTPLPQVLAGTTAFVNGNPMPLLYVGIAQINAQIPYETSSGDALLIIETNGLRSSPVRFRVSDCAPGVLTDPGSTHVLAVNSADGSINSSEHPTASGSVITAYVTGQGAVDYVVSNGQPAPSDPLSRPKAAVEVAIGGQKGEVLFAGLAPGLVGIMQLNVRVPAVSDGEQTLDIMIGGISGNSTVVSVGGQQ